MKCNTPDDLLLFQQLREAVPQTCPMLVVTEQAHDQKFRNIDATSLISWPCDVSTVLTQINALIGHLNPQLPRPAARLSQPRRGFIYPVHHPPPDLPVISRLRRAFLQIIRRVGRAFSAW